MVQRPEQREIAVRVSALRRRVMGAMPGVETLDVPGGWMCVHPPTIGAPFPSSNRNRALWADGPTSMDDVARVLEVVRSRGLARMFFWLGPSAWSEGLDAGLAGIGARPWPHVTYPALIRGTREPVPLRPSALTARVVPAAETPGVLAGFPWHNAEMNAAIERLVVAGAAELHVACDGERPVTLGALLVDGRFAYLGFGSTEPAYQKRGGQSLLIASRVARAAEHGADWALVETNSAVPISLGNLTRCGFEAAFSWRVYQWEAG
jgi:GNAT superfamily N-acetyltransferase